MPVVCDPKLGEFSRVRVGAFKGNGIRAARPSALGCMLMGSSISRQCCETRAHGSERVDELLRTGNPPEQLFDQRKRCVVMSQRLSRAVAEHDAGIVPERRVSNRYEIVTIRKQKPGESIPSVTLVEGIASAVPGETPGAAVGTSVQIVATIVAINRSKKTVDLKGPDGVVETVNVAHPSNLRHVKVGTDIVITLTKVMAISLDKETSA